MFASVLSLVRRTGEAKRKKGGRKEPKGVACAASSPLPWPGKLWLAAIVEQRVARTLKAGFRRSSCSPSEDKDEEWKRFPTPHS